MIVKKAFTLAFLDLGGKGPHDVKNIATIDLHFHIQLNKFGSVKSKKMCERSVI